MSDIHLVRLNEKLILRCAFAVYRTNNVMTSTVESDLTAPPCSLFTGQASTIHGNVRTESHLPPCPQNRSSLPASDTMSINNE